jgi:hypothetical protein
MLRKFINTLFLFCNSMNYKVLLIFVMTAITLSLAIYSSNAFAINESSVSPSSLSSFVLSTDNDSSTIKTNQNYSTSNLKNTQQNNILITKLLAKNLENHIQKAGAILEITSKLPQVRDVPFANVLNQTLNTLHGIPQNADIDKRQVANNIINNNNDFQIVIFVMPNGEIYFDEPYSRQQISTTSNLAFRDYFQGAIKTNDIFLGDPTTSASSGQMQSVIAVPVYSLKDNSTIVGVWAGGLDFGILNKELQSFNITTSAENNNTRAVYVGHLGQKVADSDINKSKMPESFANLQSFKNAINGQSGSVIDTVDNKKMLVTYQPVNVFHNTWVVLLMQPLQ